MLFKANTGVRSAKISVDGVVRIVSAWEMGEKHQGSYLRKKSWRAKTCEDATERDAREHQAAKQDEEEMTQRETERTKEKRRRPLGFLASSLMVICAVDGGEGG